MPSHWQPKERKEDVADDIRDWVHKVSDPHAKLETLTQMSKNDLVVLMLAIRDSENTPIEPRCEATVKA